MITLQLYLLQLLFVVIFSDGIHWSQWWYAPDCKYNKQPFCMVMEDVYRRNNKFLSILKASNETTFDGDKERITKANGRIRVVLGTGEKSKLLMPLTEALETEANALFQLSVSCSGERKETAPCKKGFEEVCVATAELIFAIGEVAEGTHKTAVENVHNNTRNSEMNENEICMNQYYITGRKILEALEANGPLA